MIKRLAVIIVITFFVAVLTGCNTVHGLGKDIESLGQAMKQSSHKNMTQSAKE
jgi:predicted small secreted protein